MAKKPVLKKLGLAGNIRTEISREFIERVSRENGVTKHDAEKFINRACRIGGPRSVETTVKRLISAAKKASEIERKKMEVREE